MSRIDVIQIDTSVPVPAYRGKYPLDSMEVGESFVVQEQARRSVASLASALKRTSTKEFTIRKQADGNVRVWRVK